MGALELLVLLRSHQLVGLSLVVQLHLDEPALIVGTGVNLPTQETTTIWEEIIFKKKLKHLLSFCYSRVKTHFTLERLIIWRKEIFPWLREPLSHAYSLKSTLHLSFKVELDHFISLQSLGGVLMDLMCNNYEELFVKILSFLICNVENSSFFFCGPHANGLSSILWLVKNSPLFRTSLLDISLWAWQCHTLRKLLRAWGMVKLFNILGALDESLSDSSIELPKIASSISQLMFQSVGVSVYLWT